MYEANLLTKTREDIEQMSREDVSNLIKELQIHQIELKTQNEELLSAQQELQKSRDRYFDLYNFAPAVYLTINCNGIILDSNLTTSTLLDIKRSDLIGMNMVEFISSEDHEVYFVHTQKLMSTKTRQECVIKIKKNSGENIFARMESDFVQDECGDINQRSVFLDITSCKRAEHDLKKTVSALTKSNIELERFAYVASHDLREPLRNISSCTQLLDMKYGNVLDGEGKELIHYTIESVQQINALISDLLSYSKNCNKSGRFDLVDCNSILQHVIENLQQLIAETGAIITFEDLPEIVADSTQIVQLFQNLISNSIKHHDGGRIEVHIGIQKQEEHWLFSVKDNGPGIESEYFEQIFEIFKRLDNRSKYNGTGIGLAICKQVVDNHGGKIWAESIVGKGSTFCFMLPSRKL